MTNTTTQWIIGLIDRLAERFIKTGFAYAYESPNDQHVVELSDAETFGDKKVRLALCQEWERFQDAFPEETLLFIGPDDVFAVENPICHFPAKIDMAHRRQQQVPAPVE